MPKLQLTCEDHVFPCILSAGQNLGLLQLYDSVMIINRVRETVSLELSKEIARIVKIQKASCSINIFADLIFYVRDLNCHTTCVALHR